MCIRDSRRRRGHRRDRGRQEVTEAKPVDPQRGDSEPVTSQEFEPTGPKVTDKRRLDPKTGAVRGKPHAAPDLSDAPEVSDDVEPVEVDAVSYTHLRAHETVLDLVCRL